MTISQLLNFATKKLSKTSDSPALDAELLLSHTLNKSKEYSYTNPKKSLERTQVRTYLKLINKRAHGWPVAYLTNQKEFFGLKFYVDKNVLIPRPETEGLVELVLEEIKNKSCLKILDVGTGSGNIILSIARRNVPMHVPTRQSLFFASDISSKALVIAKKNAKFYKVKIHFKLGSLLMPWKKQHFDVLIANLPYLSKKSDPSTKFEPKQALLAQNQGLKLYEELFKQLASSLSPHPSSIFLEIGHNQGPQIKKLVKKFLPAFEIKIYKDLSGRNRYAIISL